jgi:hypothetical protein
MCSNVLPWDGALVYLVTEGILVHLPALLVCRQMERHGKLAFTSYVNKSDKMDCFISCGLAAVIKIKELLAELKFYFINFQIVVF